MSDQQPEPTPEGSRRSSMTLILALVAIALVVIGAVLVAVTRHSDAHESASATSVPGSAAPVGQEQTGFAAPDVDAFGRRVDIPNNRNGQTLVQTSGPRQAGDPLWLTAAPTLPEQGGWQRVFGVSVPFSTSDGPTAINDGIPSGYSHTPQGAALAAVFITWEAYARPGDWTLRERMEVMTDADHIAFDRLKAAGKVPELAPAGTTRWLVAPDAYQVESWSAAGDLCVLRLATKAEPATTGGGQRWRASQIVMTWDGQTWRLRLAADRQLPASYVNSLEGWTTW
ncbi:hypothetical protein [Nocardia sp. NBC_01327]|uniref:hypothetical protein n=1 Tax=Nocardia sp. NBC_01327 TaxID=2903593 RepID=UPI002E0EA0BE|nr:hypothetical protein OG326_42545 [Nocardia sp. NBC_01327]